MATVHTELQEMGKTLMDPQVTCKLAKHRIKAVMNQFTELVSASPCLSVHNILITCCTQANSQSTLEDMLIGGVVVYLSVDCQVAALSTTFSGSELGHWLLDKYGADVDEVLD